MKALIFLDEDTTGTLFHCDVVEFEGIFWLVPEWLENRDTGWKIPARIVSFQHLPHQFERGAPFGDFVLNVPVSKTIFDGAPPPTGSPYRVIQRPNIQVPIFLT